MGYLQEQFDWIKGEIKKIGLVLEETQKERDKLQKKLDMANEFSRMEREKINKALEIIQDDRDSGNPSYNKSQLRYSIEKALTE